MVFYFTATGNSLYVAKTLDHRAVSIPQAIHEPKHSYSDRTIGIVCPVYGHDLPPMVKEFLRSTELQTDYLYMILTYGNVHGGAPERAQEFLAECGRKADYIAGLLMVDNYLPAFDLSDQLFHEPEKRIEEHLQAIRKDLRKKRRWIEPATKRDLEYHEKLVADRASHPAPDLKHLIRIKKNCLGCGICTRVCPAGCIVLAYGRAKPVMDNCQMCLACVHLCPQKAVALNIPEKNPYVRFRNAHVRLFELIRANEQESIRHPEKVRA